VEGGREVSVTYSSPSPSSPDSLFYVDEKLEKAKSKALRILQYGALSSWEVQQRLQEKYFVEAGTASEVASWLLRMVRLKLHFYVMMSETAVTPIYEMCGCDRKEFTFIM
jgi:hypothetical protein